MRFNCAQSQPASQRRRRLHIKSDYRSSKRSTLCGLKHVVFFLFFNVKKIHENPRLSDMDEREQQRVATKMNRVLDIVCNNNIIFHPLYCRAAVHSLAHCTLHHRAVGDFVYDCSAERRQRSQQTVLPVVLCASSCSLDAQALNPVYAVVACLGVHNIAADDVQKSNKIQIDCN